MFPPPGLGHAVPAIPNAIPEASLAAAVTTSLPVHYRPTIAIGNAQVNNPTPAVDAVIVTMTATGATSAAVTSSPNHPDPALDKVECRLLGPFALLVQLALGALALLALVYKRWRERPQRPVKIWFFDASKQVFGSVLVHIVNVFMSMLTSGRLTIKPDPVVVGHGARQVAMMLLRRDDDYTPNPCSFYLLNLAIDVSHSPTTTPPLFSPQGDHPSTLVTNLCYYFSRRQ